MGLIYEEVSEFTLLFSGNSNTFFVMGCSNPSSLIAFLGLGLWFTEASQWVGTLYDIDTYLLNEDFKRPI